MSETKSSEEKMDTREELKGFAIMTALIGIFALALWGLYYLIFSILLGKPLIYIFSTIGDILENIIGNLPEIGQIAVLFFMIAGILGFGSLLKDEDDINIYKILVIVLWSAALAAFIGLWGYSIFKPIPISAIIGFSFVLFISPPIVFGILKGLTSLYKII